MKRLRPPLKSLPLILACTVAGAATVWSPIGCGCTDAWESVAAGIGAKEIERADQLTARAVANGIAKQFSGKLVNQSDLPFATSTSDCAVSSLPTRSVRCRWWLWESRSGKKGFDVVVATNSRGVFERVTVLPVKYNDPMVGK